MLRIHCVFLLLFAFVLSGSDAVKCWDCVGKDCMGSFCEGEYCVMTEYAPRWGESAWGESKVVKGCMSGTMVRKDIRNHCEAVDDNGEEVFTCFCGKDYCNGPKRVQNLKVDAVPLVKCVCKGKHCRGRTCQGELCTYVKNLVTGETEQGCINASVPIVERRSVGACMVPPITGAMHHTLARSAEDLLVTESCVCGTDNCNRKKPVPHVPENMKCSAFVQFELVGTKTSSRNITCDGEYCFKSKIESNIGQMAMYKTMGCASFVDNAELPEEFDPKGCANFQSEEVKVESCFTTTDKNAIARALRNQERPSRKSQRGKDSRKPKIEIDEYEDDEGDYPDEFEEEENSRERQSSKKKPSKVKQRVEQEDEEEEEPLEESSKEVEEDEREEQEEEEGRGKEEEKAPESSTKHYIFEAATEPPIPDDSNVTLVAVFLFIMLLIVASGAVWKFELHKKLFRANYDTVAGG
ncbi:hypothetical protein L596_007104 [Steinernema carpocapsae]|uniref:Activin types I and II receptor domain-containing protein n=1 Tax=Steinernema carpocapsae TaxID=34508 RepID=A0A4U5P876_STECR|nr:hypothetical protein L596_007104 [Steinernema carpocapsae]